MLKEMTDIHTSFMPKSTATQVILSLVHVVLGNDSEKARTRTRTREQASRIITAPAEE